NLVEGCTICDNGFKSKGLGIQFLGETHDVIIRDNLFADSGRAQQKIGIQVSAEAEGTKISGNTFTGMEQEVVYLPTTENQSSLASGSS
ncbi:MAG TPA: hypothetical protein EYG11_03655, partial [Candidatus Latescibacteria bacterium]|nr:hypothetical protein [Candidatus Latescibacterota bacterium]